MESKLHCCKNKTILKTDTQQHDKKNLHTKWFVAFSWAWALDEGSENWHFWLLSQLFVWHLCSMLIPLWLLLQMLPFLDNNATKFCWALTIFSWNSIIFCILDCLNKVLSWKKIRYRDGFSNLHVFQQSCCHRLRILHFILQKEDILEIKETQNNRTEVPLTTNILLLVSLFPPFRLQWRHCFDLL
jgi:hypothetical protein